MMCAVSHWTLSFSLSLFRTFWQQRQDEFESLVSSSIHPTDRTLLSPVATYTQAPIKPTYIAIAALYAVFVISLFASNDVASLSSSIDGNVVPFTSQEWYWAIRDGYVSDMFGSYFKNGGLLISENTDNNNALFTPREIWWSMRDGYGWNLFNDWFRNGGGVVVAGSSTPMDDNTLVLTPREVWWSLRDGYVSNLLWGYCFSFWINTTNVIVGVLGTQYQDVGMSTVLGIVILINTTWVLDGSFRYTTIPRCNLDVSLKLWFVWYLFALIVD